MRTLSFLRRGTTVAVAAALALLAGPTFTSSPASAVTTLSTSQMQSDLKGLLYYSGPINGRYTPQTTAAVAAFQKDNCLKPIGDFGPITTGKLIAKVKAVQAKAGATQDGIYGPQTTAKVVAYQRAHKIPTGGQAGPLTMKAMGIQRTVTKCSTPTAPATSAVGGPIRRAEELARGQFWVNRRVPYSMSGYYPDPQGRRYRTDCSGFVSMALHLPVSASTVSLPQYVHRISWAQLRPGDIVGNLGAGTAGANGHVVIFMGWANSSHTVMNTMEQRGGAGATRYQRPKGFRVGSMYTLPYRYNKIAD